MSEPFIGEIRPVPFTFAPRFWAFCNGQLMSISQNTPLFSLLGTTFGGNGTTNFAVPDLRGRVPIGMGQGPGLPEYVQGQVGGAESHALTSSEMAAHTHGYAFDTTPAASYTPAGTIPAVAPRPIYGPASQQKLAADSLSLTGGGLPHNNLQPYLTISYIIALAGIFPSRP